MPVGQGGVLPVPHRTVPGSGVAQFCGRIADELRNGRTVEMFSDSYSSSLCLVASELATWPAERLDLKELPSVISVCGDRAL